MSRPHISFFYLALTYLCLAQVSHAEENSGVCISLISAEGIAVQELEFARDQPVFIQGGLGAVDEALTLISHGKLKTKEPIYLIKIQSKNGIVAKIAFPHRKQPWEHSLALLDLDLTHWEQLGELSEPGKFTVGEEVGLVYETAGANSKSYRLALHPKNSDPLVAPLKGPLN